MGWQNLLVPMLRKHAIHKVGLFFYFSIVPLRLSTYFYSQLVKYFKAY
ncbi:hypothetical protein FHW74_003388 [Atlantibacter sp. RC6]|nr:hypothetical protein [Atlantibacter sp. RC6]